MANFLGETVGLIGFVIFVFFPGAWITFGLHLSSWSFWTRLCIGAILSPIMVFVQFYVIRLLGASFEITVPLLAAINLPVAVLIWKKRGSISLPDHRTMILWGIVVFIPLACLAGMWITLSEWRLFWGHPWMYADTVYSFANGELVPEDTVLAGFKLSYPWALHIYQAVLSYALNSPPISNYIWANLLWLIFMIHLNSKLVSKLGGNRLAAVSSVIFLLFGANILGYILPRWGPYPLTKLLEVLHLKGVWIWGDYRYTPWLLKFYSFNNMPMALALVSAIAFLMAESWSEADPWWKRPLLLLMLLSGIGLIYPVLIPPAYVLVSVGGLCILIENYQKQERLLDKKLLAMGAAIALSMVIIFIYLDIVTQDSMKAEMLGPSTLSKIGRKSLESLVVLFPLILGMLLTFFKCWKSGRHATLVLISGAISSIVLYMGLAIPYWSNEYKFIFTASICLAPFCGLALEPLLKIMREWTIPFIIFFYLVMASPLIHKTYLIYKEYPDFRKNIPLLDTQNFDLRLDDGERFSGITDAIREKTTVNTILVSDQIELHLPTITRRKLLVGLPDGELRPDLKYFRLGLNVRYETYLSGLRGYNDKQYSDRITLVKNLFHTQYDDYRMESLNRILELGRPIGIIIDKTRNSSVLKWFEDNQIGNPIYQGNDLVLWIVEPEMG